MKNTKFTKIALLILSVALLVGAAFAVSTSATETPTEEEILSDMKVNLKYGDMLYFLCLVDAENLGPDADVRFTLYKDADCTDVAATVKAEYLEEGDVKLGTDPVYNTGYYADFATHGVSAVCMGVDYYVKATIVKADGNVEGEAVKCSVIKYLLERLYEDNPTDIQREHYENTIAYGSTAQKVTGDDKTNVADYLYVAAQNGTVNGKAGAVVLKGDALNFTYTGTEDASGLAYWLDPAGNKTVTATVSGTYAPRFADYTFSDLTNNTVFTTTQTASGRKTISLSDGATDVSKYKNFFAGNIVADGRSYECSIVDGKFKFSNKGGTNLYLLENKDSTYRPNTAGTTYNYTYFEADITLDLTKDANGTQKTGATFNIDFSATGSYEIYRMVFAYTATDGKVKTYFQTNVSYNGLGKDRSSITTQIAEANSNTASFTLKAESCYIASTKDTALVISINDTPIWICDSRAQAYETDYPTVKSDIDIYKNTDGVYVNPCVHYAKSATDDTPNNNTTFGAVAFTFHTGAYADLYFDNIIFDLENRAESDLPVYNVTKK